MNLKAKRKNWLTTKKKRIDDVRRCVRDTRESLRLNQSKKKRKSIFSISIFTDLTKENRDRIFTERLSWLKIIGEITTVTILKKKRSNWNISKKKNLPPWRDKRCSPIPKSLLEKKTLFNRNYFRFTLQSSRATRFSCFNFVNS